MRFVNKNFFINMLYNTAVPYPAPANLNYFWSFGIFALVCLVIQILTGIFLAMYYVPDASLAFASVEHIMRDVNFGWLIRYLHLNGASFFFFVVYLHMARGFFYGSYASPREWLWIIGVVIYLLMILTAFLGYVLPWGQMSFWAATVITNFATAIPFIGTDLVQLIWGGFSVDNPTLNRFFSLHYLLPFVILGLVILHLLFLHEYKSTNPLGIESDLDTVPFSPYFIVKDGFAVLVFLFVYFFFVFFFPNTLGHPDNYIMANPLVTPSHIVPEWYFLPLYGILRSVPDKLGGVLLLLSSIIILALLPFMVNKDLVKNSLFRKLNQGLIYIFFFNFILLGWIGGNPVEEPFFTLGQIFTLIYFLYFLILSELSFLFDKVLLANLTVESVHGIPTKPLFDFFGKFKIVLAWPVRILANKVFIKRKKIK